MATFGQLRGIWLLGGFSKTSQLGFFGGPNLEAVLESTSTDLGSRYAITFLRPMTDAVRCGASIGKMDTTNSRVTYSAEQPMNEFGLVPTLVETRYARIRIRIPAGTVWTYCMGARPEVIPDQGDR